MHGNGHMHDNGDWNVGNWNGNGAGAGHAGGTGGGGHGGANCPGGTGNTADAVAAQFAQIGAVFNDATDRLVGGITSANQSQIVNDLHSVQSRLQALITQHPDQFTGVAGIHAQNVVDQINLEMQAINALGTDPTAPKYINDVQRDLIDIVQGDPTLQAMATSHGGNGFAAVPDLLAKPAQFQGNQTQTDFMRQFAADAVDLGNKAVALEQSAGGGDPAAKAALIQQIQAFDTNANAFTLAQGGVYSARFNNEFSADGVNGTASRALIDGLQTNNLDKVQAGAEVLAANAADVAGNMLGIGQPAPVTGPRIPDHVDNLAQAGAVFNDATTQLIGGVWSGNQTAVLQDLQATQTFIQQLVAADPATFSGKAATDANAIVAKLGQEITAVNAVGSDPHANATIHALQTQIIQIVQNDAVLQQAATTADTVGFTPLPQPATAAVAHAGGAHGGGTHAIDPAIDPHGAASDALAHAFSAHTGHMWG